jgi:hypothetical protein
MTLIVSGSIDVVALEQRLYKNPADELKNHHAFYSHLTAESAEKLLMGTQPMTYLLWTEQVVDDAVEQYHLSYVETNLKVAHLTFGYTDNWYYINCDSYHAATLSDLIPKIMRCNPKECKMLLNPGQFRGQRC